MTTITRRTHCLDDQQTADRDGQRFQTAHCKKRGVPVGGAGGEHRHAAHHRPVSFPAAGRTARLAGGHPAGGGCRRGGPLCLRKADGGLLLPGQPQRQAGAAPHHSGKAFAAGAGLFQPGLHLRGGTGDGGGHRAAGKLLRRVSAPVLLQPAGPADPVLRAGPHQPFGGGGAADLRAADPGFHRAGADLCQKAASPLLGPVHRIGRQLSGKPAGPDHPENLSGGRGTPPADERGGRALPAHHHEGAHHAAELHHHHGSGGLRRRGAGHHRGRAAVRRRADRSVRLLCNHHALGGFLPAHASAGLLLPHCHERHGRLREDLQAAGSAGAPGQDRRDRPRRLHPAL